MPIHKLKTYFDTPGRTRDLLRSLGSRGGSGEVGTLPSTHVQVFAILLLVGHGIFIEHFIHHPNLSDCNLPFPTEPPHWPASSDEGFFANFYAKQWLFYVPRLHFDCSILFYGQSVLPITEKKRLGTGVSATVNKVSVEASYNRLIPQAQEPSVGLSLL